MLVNNAGGALGADPVESADLERLAVDVRGQRARHAAGHQGAAAAAGGVRRRAPIVVLSSTAGLVVYEGGGGYAAAKHAQTALAETLRLELCGRPVRVIEIDPGMVQTDEFALVRFDGDAERAAAVYAGVAEPLVADDIADCVAWCATRPHHVNIDRLVVRPLAQAAQHKVHRVMSCRIGRSTRGTTDPEPAAAGRQLARGAARGGCCGRPARSSTSGSAGAGHRPWTCYRRLARAARPPGDRPGDRPGAGRCRAGLRRPARLDFARGGFELGGLRPACWCGR